MGYADQLKEGVKAAIRKTVGDIVANHPRETLNGYALVTDDNLRTLGHVASSREFTEPDPSVRFEPVDWVFNDGAEAFDEPCALLVGRADAASTGDLALAHVRESFNALVEALQELKSVGLFGEDVFLTVISTDPSELLERLEAGAVRALNSAELHRQWQDSVGVG